jgi:HEAT repeat protein
MKSIASAIALSLLIVGGAAAQLSPKVKALLASEDEIERQAAFQQLTAEDPITPEAKTPLVNLLERENAIVQAAFPKGGVSEAYGEYVGWLTEAVMKIADAEPDRTDVWHALMAINPGPGKSAYGRWLGTHGDKALPYLLAYAADRRADDWDKNNRTDALESLAQIVAYARRPETVHHLVPKDLQMIETLIRGGIDDADVSIRMAAISAMEIIGDPRDLPTLDRIALTDTYVERNGGPSGAEIQFPIRQYARNAAEQMRATLAAVK